jgi:Dual specificity phosphatase, catalytic domain
VDCAGKYCEACWNASCFMCGNWVDGVQRKYRTGPNISCWHCFNCEDKVNEIGVLGCQALVQLSQIKPGFQVWTHGRPNMQVAQPQPALACQNVYIGDLGDAADIDKLDRSQIRAVIILCPEKLHGNYATLISDLGKRKITCVLWPADDDDQFDFLNHVLLAGALDIMTALSARTPLLVCCWAGVNRSACLVIGFLVAHHKMSLVHAVEQITERRGAVLTNHHFRFLLVRMCQRFGYKLP